MKSPRSKSGSDGRVPGAATRREFVRTTAAAGAAALLGIRCGDSETAPDGGDSGTDGPDAIVDVTPEAGDGDVRFDDVPLGQVVLVRAATPAQAVVRGLELMGGLSFIRPGQKVVLKPNGTGPVPPPDTTSCEVLGEMVRRCVAAGAGEVIVAERAFGPIRTSTTFDLLLCDADTKSLREVIEEAGGIFRPLDDEPWDPVTLTGTDFEEPLLVPRILSEVDHFINVPALKTHEQAVFTMSLKNLFGFVHPDTRNNQVHNNPLNDADPERPLRMWGQMNLAFHPILNVMDGILARTTGGPMPPGDTAETNMILLSKDRVALDAVGLAVLKVYGTTTRIENRPVWNQVQLAEAVRAGVGVRGPDEITLVGDGIDELAEIEAKLRET